MSEDPGRLPPPSRLNTPDGSWISFRKFGQGPAILLVHGLMSASHSHEELAKALAVRFTIIAPDRRGRGASGPAGSGPALESEVHDLALLMDHFDAQASIGISLGATIVLEAALRRGRHEPVVAFDPPLATSALSSMHWLARYRRELGAGERESALVTAMLGTQLGPPGMRLIPRFLLKLMVKRFAASDAALAPANATMLDLVGTLDRDLEIVTAAGGAERFSGMNPVLLVGGERSPAYFKRALAELSRALPNARSIELKGLGHEAANNSRFGGSPERFAGQIMPFLGTHLASGRATIEPATGSCSPLG